ncbi:MAG: glycosyltransferase family 4 protein [Chthoniobacter sp.]|nr:glycosyltransferase family 4 protein [Chthoniobacter sp.]
MSQDVAASGSRRKIAFIKRGLFSNTNRRTREELERNFPEFQVEEIDIGLDLLKKHPGVMLLNWLWVFALYGWAILRHSRPVSPCFYYTPYIFRQIRRLLLAHLAGRHDEFAFTFSTQSLFDAHLDGVPHFIYTDHTHLANLRSPTFHRAFLATEKWIAFEREVYHHASRIFVMGENTRVSLVEQYGCAPDRICCAHAGSNIDTTPVPLDNTDYGNRTILFVGIDWERKGGLELVAAFQQLLARVPDARLRIVGASPKITHPQIEILGRVPLDRVKQLLTQATILCLPSRFEPFGIAVLEAFAIKIPVVVTRIGALEHLVQDGRTGRVVPPGDTAALATALVELLSDPEKCRRYGETGHAFAREHFTWEAVGKKFRAEITTALKSPAQ